MRQGSRRRRTELVKTPVPSSGRRYKDGVRDVLFPLVVAAFFALTTLLVAGCARIVGRTDTTERVDR
jgi:hypothetical protein